jgi:hypothetical protein
MSVRETGHSTKFICRLPFCIPARIRRKQPATFMMLFSTQKVDMKQELEKAYWETTYKRVPVNRLIEGALRSVLTKAVSNIFMKAKRSNDPHAKYMEGGPEEFAKAARPRRVSNTKLREKRAIRLARLYQKVLPTAAEILEFMKHCDHKNDHERCKTDLEKNFPKSWITYVTRGGALRHLPEIPGHDTSQSLDNLDCTPRQLAVGVVWSVEDARGEQPSLSANTILQDYIPLGAKLLGISSFSRHS